MKPVGSRSSDLLPLTPLSGWVFQSVVKPGEHAEKTKALLPAHSPESRSRAASQGTTGAEFGSWSWQPAAALGFSASVLGHPNLAWPAAAMGITCRKLGWDHDPTACMKQLSNLFDGSCLGQLRPQGREGPGIETAQDLADCAHAIDGQTE